MRNVVLACVLMLAGCASAPADTPDPAPDELRRLSHLEVMAAFSGNVLCFEPDDAGTCESIGVPQSVTASEVRTREYTLFNIDDVIEFIATWPDSDEHDALGAALAEQRADGGFLYVKFMEPAHGAFDAARSRWCVSGPPSAVLERVEFYFSQTPDANTSRDRRLTPELEASFRAFMTALVVNGQSSSDADTAAMSTAIMRREEMCFAYWGVVRNGRVTMTAATIETASGEMLAAMRDDMRVVPAGAPLAMRGE
jgi:hypothetical protein